MVCIWIVLVEGQVTGGQFFYGHGLPTVGVVLLSDSTEYGTKVDHFEKCCVYRQNGQGKRAIANLYFDVKCFHVEITEEGGDLFGRGTLTGH